MHRFSRLLRFSRFLLPASRFLVVGALGLAAAASAYAVLPTVLQARTSWIGNTFGFGDGVWTQINITAIAVTPDGRVYTNAPWMKVARK